MFGVHKAYFNTQKYYAQGVNVLDRLNASTYHRDMHIGKVIEALAERAGLSDNALADKAGMKQPTVTRILNGESADPRRSNIERLGSVFGYSADRLYQMAMTGNLVFDAETGEMRTPIYRAESKETEACTPSSEADIFTAELIEEISRREISAPLRLAIMQIVKSCPARVEKELTEWDRMTLNNLKKLHESATKEQAHVLPEFKEAFLGQKPSGAVDSTFVILGDDHKDADHVAGDAHKSGKTGSR